MSTGSRLTICASITQLQATTHPATETELQKQADELMKVDYSIHFHVWTQHEVLELMLALRPQIGFDIESFCKNDREIICVLRKVSEPGFALGQVFDQCPVEGHAGVDCDIVGTHVHAFATILLP